MSFKCALCQKPVPRGVKPKVVVQYRPKTYQPGRDQRKPDATTGQEIKKEILTCGCEGLVVQPKAQKPQRATPGLDLITGLLPKSLR